MEEAADYCRARKGPALVRATCVRPYSHSMSDDQRAVPHRGGDSRTRAERDPLTSLRRRLIDADIASAEELDTHEAEWRKDVLDASERAQLRPKHQPGHAFDSPVQRRNRSRAARSSRARRSRRQPVITCSRRSTRSCTTRWRAIRDIVVVRRGRGRRHERRGARRRPRARAACSRPRMACRATYGKHRVFNSPLAEANIVGRAVGMATRGLKPVVEIQFFDYIWPAYMQIKNELAMMRWRSFGNFKSPMVVRVATGGYLQGGAVYHSQSGVNLFTHLPGLRVVMPSNAHRRGGPAAHRDPLRRSGDVPRAQAPLPPAVRQGRLPGRGLHDPAWARRGCTARATTSRSSPTARTLRRSELAAKELEKEGGLGRDPRPALALARGTTKRWPRA